MGNNTFFKKFKSKILILFVVTLSMFTVLTGCANSYVNNTTGNSPAKLEKVKIGVSSTTFGIPLHVAKAKGIFEKYGIDAQLTTYSFGIDTLNALVSKQEDIGMAMDYAALTRVGKGGMKFIAVSASPASDNQMLFVKESINKPEDLKGKKLGEQRGTINEYMWERYLEENKITSSEVQIEPLTSNAELLSAYSRGDIDALWMTKTFEDKVMNVKGTKKIADLTSINFRMIGVIAANNSFIKDRSQTVTNFLKALNESNEFIKAHPDEAADIAYKEMKLPKEATLKELKNDWEFDVRFKQEDYLQLNGIKEWATKRGLITDKFDLKDVISTDSVKSVFADRVTYKP